MSGAGCRGVLATLVAVPVLAACTGDPQQVGGDAAPLAVSPTAGSPRRATTTPPARTPDPTPAATSSAATSSAGREAGTTPPAGALAAGGYDVLVSAVDPVGRRVTVDVVDYLRDDAAVRACREDGVDPDTTPCATGYIRNTPTPLRTVPVAAGARITMSEAVNGHRATLAAVAGALPGRNLYTVRIEGGAVVALDEIYRP